MIDAAVLLLVTEKDEIVFIKRNEFLKNHAGEISFPGGKFDKNQDKTLLDTAIREVYEEIGVQKDFYTVYGTLPIENTVSTNFRVHTFLAKIIQSPDFRLNEKEVEKILLIPIKHLKNEKFKQIVPIKIEDRLYNNTFYYYKNYLIWGATSRILDNFLKYFEIIQKKS